MGFEDGTKGAAQLQVPWAALGRHGQEWDSLHVWDADQFHLVIKPALAVDPLHTTTHACNQCFIPEKHWMGNRSGSKGRG